jgi:acyl-[acyl-carrier-protein]-phospholipid O-acyltransferase/long-chain-fatty-acid--[acyl-carrier-protein] ligase
MLAAAIVILALVLGLWIVLALWLMTSMKLTFQQAVLYAPFKALFRVGDDEVLSAQRANPPVIYAIWHSSRLEPALMLSLLPEDTLHILDVDSANAWWLDPWRSVARTIVFNAHHVFVSRRLVRRLRGRGRLAVYLPDDPAPDQKAFRLFRAISRIAVSAEARIVPIYIEGAAESMFSLEPGKRRSLLPRLTIKTLPAMTIAELIAAAAPERPLAAKAMFDHLLRARTDVTIEPAREVEPSL